MVFYDLYFDVLIGYVYLKPFYILFPAPLPLILTDISIKFKIIFFFILKVESLCVADQMWYFPLLVPFRDHVPVKADLSDLEEQIR